MSERISRETRLPYAKFDGSIVNGDAPHGREHTPSWRGAWIYCLKLRDYESAHLIRLRNDHDYRYEVDEESEVLARKVEKATRSRGLGAPLLSIKESFIDEGELAEEALA